jgi:acyl-CoA dehydrogenase
VCIKCQVYAEEAFKEALEYAKKRESLGQPIGHFQNTAFRLAEMATEVHLGRTFLDNLISKNIQRKDIVQEVSMAKYRLGEMVNRIAYEAVQIHSGDGLYGGIPNLQDLP